MPVPFVPVQERQNFAISIVSHCGAPSHRDYYLNDLANTLGRDKIHRYGKCGNLQLPPPPFQNAAKLIGTYKFYLAFENTIQNGYVTEKLLFTLSIPIVPVYFGAMDAPNITTTSSFIRVADFQTPRDLASYLTYLDQNYDEYNKYHAWRTNTNPFNDQYLTKMRNDVPGPNELLSYYKPTKSGEHHFIHNAQCCRLCNENFVKKIAAKSRQNFYVVNPAMNSKTISSTFFGGAWFQGCAGSDCPL